MTSASVILGTHIPNLWFLPAGHWNPETTYRLAGTTWAELMERLEHEFDFVVVDSSPVLPVADAMLLGQHVDVVLLSVMRNVSQLALVYETHLRLTRVGVRMLGVVMHGVDAGSNSGGYYYAYGASRSQAAPTTHPIPVQSPVHVDISTPEASQ